jgi:Ser/Thr protein kinase RdoA (MazF antagonist)
MSEGPGIASHAPAAALASRRLIRRLGLDDAGTNVLHSSNNTIVHHPACGLVAKVWTSPDAPDALARELDVALHLAARGAEIAPPSSRVDPGPHHQDGLQVTLWEFLPHDPDPELDGNELADSLERLHGHLAAWDRELPEYRERIERIGRLLDDASTMRAVPRAGLALLRARFAEVAPPLLERAAPLAVLHGGPNSHNVLQTPAGLRWIDFEACCRGPIEADLAYLGPAATHRAGSTSSCSLSPGRCSASASPPYAGATPTAIRGYAKLPSSISPS